MLTIESNTSVFQTYFYLKIITLTYTILQIISCDIENKVIEKKDIEKEVNVKFSDQGIIFGYIYHTYTCMYTHEYIYRTAGKIIFLLCY